MHNETINIRTSRGIDGTTDVMTGISMLRKKGLRLGHIYGAEELPMIVNKMTSTDGENETRHIVVGYPFTPPKQEKERYAGFFLSEHSCPKSFKRCLDNLMVYRM